MNETSFPTKEEIEKAAANYAATFGETGWEEPFKMGVAWLMYYLTTIEDGDENK